MLSLSTPKNNTSRRKTLRPSETVQSANRPTTRRSALFLAQNSIQETPKTPLVLIKEHVEQKSK